MEEDFFGIANLELDSGWISYPVTSNAENGAVMAQEFSKRGKEARRHSYPFLTIGVIRVGSMGCPAVLTRHSPGTQ